MSLEICGCDIVPMNALPGTDYLLMAKVLDSLADVLPCAVVIHIYDALV